MSGRSDLTDIDVVIHRTTYPDDPDMGAYLVETSTSSPRKEWVPKSIAEIEWKDEAKRTAEMTLPVGFAEEKGLV